MDALNFGERELAGQRKVVSFLPAKCPQDVMNSPRFLTHEEASLIQEAAERWLRLRDVELNPGECASRLVAESELRRPDCRRRDIASLGRSILLEVPGELEPVCIRLVRPGEEDLRRGDVSILSDLGLACIGLRICSRIRLPHGVATFIGFADTRPFFHEEFAEDCHGCA